MNIITSRLQLRPFAEHDINDVFEYCSQEGVGEMAGWHVHESVVQTKKILSDWIRQGRKLAIVWYDSGKVIGHISIDEDSEEKRRDTRELGCVLNREYHRRGIMTEAINGVLNYLFSHEISYVWACCFQENLASKGMIEKCGFVFQQEGTYDSKDLQKKFISYEYRLSAEEWYNKR
jgi:ribosomal-protein-alanine N-acetyltransferase